MTSTCQDAAYTNAWYRTRFAGASGDTAGGKRFYLRFGAANANADVYLNGTHLGRHVGGYTAFIFDATAVRRDGENVLAVKVDNATFPGLPSNGNGWVHYGGLTRKVMALSTHAYSIDPTDFASSGVYISQFAVSETFVPGDFEGSLRRGEFGMAFGAPLVADRVRLLIQVEGIRQVP